MDPEVGMTGTAGVGRSVSCCGGMGSMRGSSGAGGMGGMDGMGGMGGIVGGGGAMVSMMNGEWFERVEVLYKD